MSTNEFDYLIANLVRLAGISGRDEEEAISVKGFTPTTAAEEWRTLIDKLNSIDSEGNWGRVKFGETWCVLRQAK